MTGLLDSFTTYMQNKILDHTLRSISYTPPSSIYVALLSNVDNDGDIVEEINGSGYAREAISFDASVDGVSSNSAEVEFSVALEDWGSIPYVGLYDSLSGGNLLMWGQFSIAKYSAISSVFKIKSGQLSIELSGAFSLYLRNNLIEHIFRNNSFSSPSNIYAGIGTSVGSKNSSISEPSSESGYSRTSAISFSTGSGGGGDNPILNLTEFSFLATGGNWGTISTIGYFDAATNGNLLYVLDLDNDRTIYDGDGIDFAELEVSLEVK